MPRHMPLHRVRRSSALTLLLLLAVTFGPMLCRTGGDQDRPAGRATTAATAGTAATATEHTTAADRDHPAAADAPIAVADAPKRCSNRHAPGPDESAPLPAPHRGEPLAPSAAGPAPLAVDAAAQWALARPPTGGAAAAAPTALLPVLRI
ncbi:hypothetical protein AB0D04_19145 [Streptomyces sp. NPDC048483]|uniref:hypothetical protein n=1 Tax=Streptomyces sp. NPDC048483 TaxID=3154927 RepID=UPI00342FF228